MAATHRKTKPSLKPHLIELLRTSPDSFEFDQAIRILEMLSPHKIPLGEGSVPEKEVASLKARTYLEIPNREIHGLAMGSTTDHTPIFWLNFLSALGREGALPMVDTERLLEKLRRKDFAFQDFLDIFHHRLLSIRNRIRKKYFPGIQQISPDKTSIGFILKSFVGISLPSFQDRLTLPDRSLLHYSGLLWQKPKSAKGLEVILKHFFKLNVTISPFKGAWRQLEADQVTRIGKSGAYNILGKTASLGTQVWDTSRYLEIELSPKTRDQFESFIKGNKGFDELRDLVYMYFGYEIGFRLRIKTPALLQTPTRLGTSQARLGYSTWIYQKPVSPLDSQLVMYP